MDVNEMLKEKGIFWLVSVMLSADTSCAGIPLFFPVSAVQW